jgi:hypothetical protein
MNKFTFLFCFILLIVVKSEAQQRYALIDRKLKTPIQLTDTITKAQMDKGFFVVEKKNIDTLIGIEKYNEVQWSAGRTSLTITAIRRSVADRLNVALSTDTGEGHKYKVYIVDGALTNNDNARYLNRLIKYIHKGGL